MLRGDNQRRKNVSQDFGASGWIRNSPPACFRTCAIWLPHSKRRWNCFLLKPAAFGPYPARLEGRELLSKIASTFAAVTDVRVAIKVGSTARVIIEEASGESDVLVAMATHGYSGAARWLLGSVAEKVTHELNTDFMLVRPASADTSGEAALKTLLVPLDHSATAEKVFPTVVELAQVLNLEVLLIHVTRHAGPPEAFVPVFGAITNLKEVWEQDTAEAERFCAIQQTNSGARDSPACRLGRFRPVSMGPAARLSTLPRNFPTRSLSRCRTVNQASNAGYWAVSPNGSFSIRRSLCLL